MENQSEVQDPQQFDSFGETYGEQTTDTIHLLIEVEDAFQRFEMEVLRGMKLNIDIKNKKKTWEKISKNSRPPMNELGVSEILGRMRGRVSSISRLTFKSEEQIAIDMFHFHMSLNDLFADRGDKWEMEEDIQKPIMDACVEFVQDIVQSSRNGFNAMNIRSQYSRNETANTSESPQKRTFLGLNIGGSK